MNRWDERYSRVDKAAEPPHPLVVRFSSQLRPGRALDVACGLGRHALYLANLGWQVTAVDSSSIAIERLQKRAIESGVEIDARVADLETGEFLIEPESYDLVVNCCYLQRNLLPAIKAGVCPGGMVIAVIAMEDGDPAVKPMNPDFLLHPGELRTVFADWDVLHDFEGKPEGKSDRRAMAEIVARQK